MVLDALNLYNLKQPPYCATLLFELHKRTDSVNAVRLLYLNSSNPEKEIEEPHVLVLEGCTEFCPLADFIKLTKDLMPENWEKECQLQKSILEKLKDKSKIFFSVCRFLLYCSNCLKESKFCI